MDAFLVRLGLLFTLCLCPQPSLAQPASDTVATSAKVGSQLQILSSGLGNAAPNLRDDEPEEKAESPAEKVDAPAPEQEDQDAAAQAAQANVAPATGAAPASGLIPEIKAPTSSFPEAKGNGSLGYSFAIDAPDFRGLEPDIALTYVSNRKTKTRGSYQGWLGYGWGVDGIAVIERARPRGGVPAYAAGDVFVMNGSELVTCAAGMVSPSCATGGTHATENESYRRIRYLSGTVQWEIADRDGTKTVLSSVGTIANAGTLTPGTDAYALAYQYRWLVTSVTDTHGNAVTYSYVCPELPTCYPNTITYNGSTIRFYREARPDHLLVANGRSLSTITTRVRAVGVFTGGVLRAVYGLEYDQAQVSGASRLTKIRQFGSDATVSGSGVISGGTERPQTVFTYGSYAPGFTSSLVSAWNSSGAQPGLQQTAVEDVNSDGRQELFSYHRSEGGKFRSVSSTNVVNVHPLPGNITALSGEASGRFLDDRITKQFLVPGFSGPPGYVEFTENLAASFVSCSATTNPVMLDLCPNLPPGSGALSGGVIADVNGDGVDEYVSPTTTGGNGLLFGTRPTDVLGDGIDRILGLGNTASQLFLHSFSNGAWSQRAYALVNPAGAPAPITCLSAEPKIMFNCLIDDINGDGIDDIVNIGTNYWLCAIDSCSPGMSLGVYLGTGDRFIKVNVGIGGGGFTNADDTSLADIDGDGKAELLTSQIDQWQESRLAYTVHRRPVR